MITPPIPLLGFFQHLGDFHIFGIDSYSFFSYLAFSLLDPGPEKREYMFIISRGIVYILYTMEMEAWEHPASPYTTRVPEKK